MKPEYKVIDRIESKFALSDNIDTGTLDGYGSVFNNTDSYGDIVAPGAFTETLARHKANGTMPRMLLGHDFQGLPIGVWDSMEEDDYGLKVSGHFLSTNIGQDARITAREGQINGLSIGFIVTDFKIENGRRVILAVDLLEISLVNMPANQLALVTSVKSQENNMKKAATSEAMIKIDVDASEIATKLRELNSILAETKRLFDAIEIKTFDEDESDDEDKSHESTTAEDEEKSEDDCDCEDQADCECDDAEEEDQEAKYSKAATTAIVELRSWIDARSQKQ